MIENIHKVPTRQWKKWSEDSKIVFNQLYEHMVDNQHLYIHPKGAIQFSEFWKTTCWNAAWMAAGLSKSANRHNKVWDNAV